MFPENFVKANKFTQQWEKGYVNHPKDPGGATYNGVSLRFLKQTGIDINGDGHIDIKDILTLYRNKDQARVDEIFYKAFWRDPDLNRYEDLFVQTVLYDCNVNTGRSRSVKCLQQAVNSLGGRSLLVVDGAAGPKTFAMVMSFVCDGKGYELALEAVKARLAFHNALVQNSPYRDGRDYRPFAEGWRNRCNDLMNYLQRLS